MSDPRAGRCSPTQEVPGQDRGDDLGLDRVGLARRDGRAGSGDLGGDGHLAVLHVGRALAARDQQGRPADRGEVALGQGEPPAEGRDDLEVVGQGVREKGVSLSVKPESFADDYPPG